MLSVTLEAKRLGPDWRGIEQVFAAARVGNEFAVFRTFRIGAKPVDRCQFKMVSLIARVARSIGNIVKNDPAVVPVGEIT